MRSDSPRIEVSMLEAVLGQAGAPAHDSDGVTPRVAVAFTKDRRAPATEEGSKVRLSDRVGSLEREAIEGALASALGNKSVAAKNLGISRATLYSRIKLYEIQT